MSKKQIDTFTELEYDIKHKSIAEETVDVEIKTVRRAEGSIGPDILRGHLQRDRGLRKVREQAVKWTTEGAGNEMRSLVYCDVRHTSAAGDIMVS